MTIQPATRLLREHTVSQSRSPLKNPIHTISFASDLQIDVMDQARFDSTIVVKTLALRQNLWVDIAEEETYRI